MTPNKVRDAGDGARGLDSQVDAVLLASRVLVGISAQSLAAVNAEVTVPQLRVLVIVASTGPTSLSALADALGVHPSNATRACDRLVTLGLLDRRDNPEDRRTLLLELTPRGQRLVDAVIQHRRTAIRQILRRMPADDRGTLVPALNQLAVAAGEVESADLWSMGWTT